MKSLPLRGIFVHRTSNVRAEVIGLVADWGVQYLSWGCSCIMEKTSFRKQYTRLNECERRQTA
jgi:hypothetical protein